jgi:hypothetical protein
MHGGELSINISNQKKISTRQSIRRKTEFKRRNITEFKNYIVPSAETISSTISSIKRQQNTQNGTKLTQPFKATTVNITSQ